MKSVAIATGIIVFQRRWPSEDQIQSIGCHPLWPNIISPSPVNQYIGTELDFNSFAVTRVP